jgi:hypothetical protein
MSIEKIRAALATGTETYVKVTAEDVAAACRELGDAAIAPGTLGAHAIQVCGEGIEGPKTCIQLHRTAHGKIFTAGN